MSYSTSQYRVKDISRSKNARILYLNRCITYLAFAMQNLFQNREISYSVLKIRILEKLNLKDFTELDSIFSFYKELKAIRNKFLICNTEYAKYRKDKKQDGNRKVSKDDLLYLKNLQEQIENFLS